MTALTLKSACRTSTQGWRGEFGKRLFSGISQQGLSVNKSEPAGGFFTFAIRLVNQAIFGGAQRGSAENDQDQETSGTAASPPKFAFNNAYRRSGSGAVAEDASCLVGINPQVLGTDLRVWQALIV